MQYFRTGMALKYGSKQMQTYSIKLNYSGYEAVVFFTNVAPTQNVTDIVLLAFLLILLLYFILHFFECFYFSEYDIRMLLQTYKLTSGSSNLKT